MLDFELLTDEPTPPHPSGQAIHYLEKKNIYNINPSNHRTVCYVTFLLFKVYPRKTLLFLDFTSPCFL